MSTTNALDDGFEEAERGLDWLEKLEALQARSASDKAAYEVAEYVMKLAGGGDRAGGRPQRLPAKRGRGSGDGATGGGAAAGGGR